MTKEQLLITVNKLQKDLYQEYHQKNNNNNREGDIAEHIEAYIETYLQEHPYDSEIQIRFALFLNYPPLVHTLKSINVLRNVINYDSNNAIALLALAYIKSRCYYGVDNSLRQQLAACQTDDNEIKSMLALAQSWHYRNKDKEGELLLIISIQLCNTHVSNYEELTQLYIRTNRICAGRALAQKGLYNVRHIYYDNDCYEPIFKELCTIEHFINENVKGIFVIKPNFETLVNLACLQVIS